MPFLQESFPAQLDAALSRRSALVSDLHSEGTNAYRLFHGIAEGLPGLTIDRYGSLYLAHTFREALAPEEIELCAEVLRERVSRLGVGPGFEFVYNHRGKKATEAFTKWHQPQSSSLIETTCHEMGAQYVIRARHPGIDPWLFLDLRAGRRVLAGNVGGKSVLNLFAYTCSAGVSAAVAGASEVWNVDFASSNLAIGRKNAELNGISESKFSLIQEDCLPVIRQLAGLPSAGRRGQIRPKLQFEARHFDWVFLDPPTWAKSLYGAVDIQNDYASLFKPAVLIARPQGGRILATNHHSSVDLDDWIDGLKRCAQKAGRPLRCVEVLAPELDFPSFDGRPPLKIAICEV